MKRTYKAVLRNYFSDYARWFLAVTALLAVTFAVGISGGAGKGIWAIPVLLLVFYLLSAPLFVLYCRARRDIKNGNIEKVAVQAATIREDPRLNFRSRGGLVGRKKYRMTDETGNVYLLSASGHTDTWLTCPEEGFPLEIEVLKQARLVLHMYAEKQPHAQPNAENFIKVFRHYFTLD